MSSDGATALEHGSDGEQHAIQGANQNAPLTRSDGGQQERKSQARRVLSRRSKYAVVDGDKELSLLREHALGTEGAKDAYRTGWLKILHLIPSIADSHEMEVDEKLDGYLESLFLEGYVDSDG